MFIYFAISAEDLNSVLLKEVGKN